MLSATSQRQHIGNDKILIFYKEKGLPFNCSFRGEVNSIAFVIEPQYAEGEQKIINGWRMGCFYRKRIHWEPIIPSFIVTSPKLLRDFIFANCKNFKKKIFYF
jgi:hypothetical protein